MTLIEKAVNIKNEYVNKVVDFSDVSSKVAQAVGELKKEVFPSLWHRFKIAKELVYPSSVEVPPSFILAHSPEAGKLSISDSLKLQQLLNAYDSKQVSDRLTPPSERKTTVIHMDTTRPDIRLHPLELLADIAGWRKGGINQLWFGGRPITNMIVGTAILAGLGYGVGKLFEYAYGKKNKTADRLRKILQIIGGSLAFVPALVQWYANYKSIRSDPNARDYMITDAVKALFREWGEKSSQDLKKSASDFDLLDLADYLVTSRFLNKNAHYFFYNRFSHNKLAERIESNRDLSDWQKATLGGFLKAASVVDFSNEEGVTPFDLAQVFISTDLSPISCCKMACSLSMLGDLNDVEYACLDKTEIPSYTYIEISNQIKNAFSGD